MKTRIAILTLAAMIAALLLGTAQAWAQEKEKAANPSDREMEKYIDRLSAEVAKVLPEDWKASPIRTGEVQPTHWRKGQGVELAFQGPESSETKQRPSAKVWIMSDYTAEPAEFGDEVRNTDRAEELKPWLGRRVFYKGSLAKEKIVAGIAAASGKPGEMRAIRVAVFDFDVLKGVELEPGALTDQVNTMLAALDKVTIVNRDQIKKVAEEHKMTLAGLVDTASAAQLGKFLSANYVIVGRASRISQTNYLVLKIIDVATTVQTTVSAQSPAEKGLDALIERTKAALAPPVRELQKPQVAEEDTAFAKVRQAAKCLSGKVVLLDVSESHVNRPLADPAAQMAIAIRLKAVGIEVVVPKDPIEGWKRSLLETGRYGEKKVDFLLEGEGTSAYAAAMEGLVSCRARVELRLIAVPGRAVTLSDKGVAARVDLVEALAAKAALEEAGASALDAVIHQYAKSQEEKK